MVPLGLCIDVHDIIVSGVWIFDRFQNNLSLVVTSFLSRGDSSAYSTRQDETYQLPSYV